MYHGIKEKVRELRAAGKMFSEIRQLLDLKLPKSTISNWCKGIVLAKKYQTRIENQVKQKLQQSRVKGWKSNALKRKAYLNNIYKDNQNLVKHVKNNQVAKIALAMLYLGEGSKTNRGSLMFGNSEPNIIALFLKLLRQCYVVDEKKLRFTLQCRADQNIAELQKFWSKTTGIPETQAYKVQVDPRTKGKPSKKKNYKGVCRIDYFSAFVDTELKIIIELINKH